jgi:hypothetical protein
MSRCNARRGTVGALFAIVALANGERAAVAQAENEAAARALFTEARSLMDAGQYAQACPKLEAANRLYVGSGLLLNLGDCYEHVGRTASAWTTFGGAASAAKRELRDQNESEARQRQSALEPHLTKLSIRVRGESPQMVVKRDGTPVDRAAWITPLPIDPGTHVLSAVAPGRVSWSSSFLATEPGVTVTVDVPELAKSPVLAQVEPPRSEHVPYWTRRRIAGVATASLGVVALGVGSVLGLEAKSLYGTATDETGTARHQDSVTAVNLGNAATWTLVGGGALAVVGVTIWLTAPNAHVSVNGNGLSFVRSF